VARHGDPEDLHGSRGAIDPLPNRDPDAGPPRVRILFGAAGRRVDIEAVRGSPEAERRPVEPDEPSLDAARPEVDPEQCRRSGRARAATRGAARTAPDVAGHAAASEASASTASAVRASVTSVFTNPPRSAPRIGATLAAPSATPIVRPIPDSAAASNATVRARNVVATRRPSAANGAIRSSPIAPPARISAMASAPTLASLHDGPPMPKRATSSRDHRSMTARTPA